MTKPSDFSSQANATQPVGTKPPHVAEAILSAGATGPEVAAAIDREGLSRALAGVRPRLFAVALRMTRNPDDAEDVVQEAMLKVWRSFGRFEGRAALSTWMHRIVVNAALDHLRSRGPAPSAAPASESDGSDAGPGGSVSEAVAGTPEDLVAGAEVGAIVHRALEALPTVHRQALTLRELNGESYQSISEIVGCPIGTVMSRLHHARHRLADEISMKHQELLPRAA